MTPLPPLIHALLTDPACYDHPVEKVELVETHISWVLLTGEYAYKIKKPVNLGFLDFSTLALRQQDCIEELRLNRRLAADYYLEVVAITGSRGAPRVKGTGQPLEYAVKMRQFPVDTTLDKLAERGELGNQQIDALAARLAHFHLAECARAAADSPWGEPELIAKPVAENFALLAMRLTDPAERQLLAKLQGWCAAEHLRLAPLMRERKQNGWVRECHGDLHLANLAWVDGRLVIFDCLEFSPALRWIDVISEVAFCYMDMLQKPTHFRLSLRPPHADVEEAIVPFPLGGESVSEGAIRMGAHSNLASRFLNAWLEATGDYRGVALLRYYAVYRALVRAKVAALRAGQGEDASRAEVTGCLQLAEQIAVFTTPQLLITHGLSGSGKTTRSQQWLEQYGLIRLRSDVERKRLAGLEACARGGDSLGLYSEAFGLRTYQHLAELAEGLLRAGLSVIVDAAFLMRWERDLFRDLAQRLGAGFGILDIQADLATLRERVSRRQATGSDASDAGLRVLEQQLATARPLDEDEIVVTT